MNAVSAMSATSGFLLDTNVLSELRRPRPDPVSYTHLTLPTKA